jgi:hypothetical protein
MTKSVHVVYYNSTKSTFIDNCDNDLITNKIRGFTTICEICRICVTLELLYETSVALYRIDKKTPLRNEKVVSYNAH